MDYCLIWEIWTDSQYVYRVSQVTFERFYSCQMVYLLHNTISVLTQDFQHITKNCQNQSSWSRVENLAEAAIRTSPHAILTHATRKEFSQFSSFSRYYNDILLFLYKDNHYMT